MLARHIFAEYAPGIMKAQEQESCFCWLPVLESENSSHERKPMRKMESSASGGQKQNHSSIVSYEEEIGRLYGKCFRSTLKRLCKKCCIPFQSVHKIRKTYASLLFANNVDEKIVQRQMRHKDILTTLACYEFSVRLRCISESY